MTTTLAGLLEPRPQPLFTYYDARTGERVELSGVTTANWVSKVANLLVDELDATRGTRIRIGLPSHWLRFVWLLGAWRVGAVVTDRAGADIGLSGPDLVADEPIRLAAALRPLGGRFPSEPEGFLDIAVAVPASPDVFVDLDPPEPADTAVDLAGEVLTHADLLTTPPAPGRILREPADLLSDARALVATLRAGGSIVVVDGADEDTLARIASAEQASPQVS